MSDNEDFIGSAKKDILKKLKDSGAPDSVISAVDFLSPDDLTDLATSIAFATMPVPMLGKATKAAIGALKKTAPAANGRDSRSGSLREEKKKKKKEPKSQVMGVRG